MKHSDLEYGESYVGVVDRMSSSGNAIVELEDTHINLGPLSSEAENEQIEFTYMAGSVGKCLDDAFTPENYHEKLKKIHNGGSGYKNSSNRNIQNPANKNKLLNGKL